MSIAGTYDSTTAKHTPLQFEYKKGPQGNKISNVVSLYQPSDKEREMRAKVVKHFTYSDIIMRKPRREWNDLSTLTRMMIDQMAFNTYQPNNGDALEGDELNAWKSRAMRPIVRNKIITMAAHATAQLIFPKVFAYNKDTNSEEAKAAQVMEDLMEWAGDQSNYMTTNLHAILSALINPASIVYTEYAETYQKFKTEKKDKEWQWEERLDEDLSGFQDTIVPVDELYIANFYEYDIQRQEWLIWRRVQPYSQMEMKYGNRENFKYVKPGVQVIYNDANTTFYEVYDSNLRQTMCEEIIYWNKSLDVKLEMVNGIFMSDCDAPNLRQDKQYPFIKFGYELIDEGKCFYYKSLAFKMMQDANIINTLYPMIIDAAMLGTFKALVSSGAETISSDVVVPGAITTVGENTKIEALPVGQSINEAIGALQQAEKSINESDQGTNIIPNTMGKQTAYEISIRQKEAMVVLGLFTQMIIRYIKDYGKLRLSDILQYLTIGEAADIEGDSELVYKTFLMPNKQEEGGMKTRKISFDASLPTKPVSDNEKMKLSHQIYKEQGKDTALYKVNPILFRELKFTQKITPEAMQPLTEEQTRAFVLEAYDRFIQNPIVDPEMITKDALGVYPEGKKNPDKYIKKAPATPQLQPGMPQAGQMGGMPQMGQPQQRTGQTGQLLSQLTK